MRGKKGGGWEEREREREVTERGKEGKK
jgi:hypothetical protein